MENDNAEKNGDLRLLHGLVYDEKWQFEEPLLVKMNISHYIYNISRTLLCMIHIHFYVL
jgi:hypothetical protein